MTSDQAARMKQNAYAFGDTAEIFSTRICCKCVWLELLQCLFSVTHWTDQVLFFLTFVSKEHYAFKTFPQEKKFELRITRDTITVLYFFLQAFTGEVFTYELTKYQKKEEKVNRLISHFNLAPGRVER